MAHLYQIHRDLLTYLSRGRHHRTYLRRSLDMTYDARITYPCLDACLEYLVTHGYITSDDEHKETYALTSKGRTAIESDTPSAQQSVASDRASSSLD